jgi:hypothetical protein
MFAVAMSENSARRGASIAAMTMWRFEGRRIAPG